MITSVGPVHNAQVCYIPRRDPPSPRRSFPFSTLVLYPVDPPPFRRSLPFSTSVFYPVAPVLRISHFGSLTCRSPRPVLGISHSVSITRRSPRPVLGISHSGSLTRRSPRPILRISHFDYLTRRSPRLEHTGITKNLIPTPHWYSFCPQQQFLKPTNGALNMFP